MDAHQEHHGLPSSGPRGCPVRYCPNRKRSEADLFCRGHWFQVPKPIRDRIWELFRSGLKKDEHRRLCAEALSILNAEADASAPRPVRRWADMTEAEKARIREQTRPPPTPSPSGDDARAERRRAARAGEAVQVTAQRLVRETEKAVLFMVNGEEKWFPKSVLEDRDQQRDESWVL